MPELPDLTVFAESLSQRALHRPIRRSYFHGGGRLSVPAEVLTGALTGASFTEIRRVGKELLFKLDNGHRLLVHLMLAGGFALGTAPKPSAPVWSATFADGETLVLFDPKGLATLGLDPDLEGRAPDALEVTPELLEGMLRRKPKAVVKAVLIDQKIVAGIGNAYADEILWEARIAPQSVAGKIPAEAVARLSQAIRSVLQRAITHLRQTQPGMMAGEVRDFLAVHRPKAVLSPTGEPIIVKDVAGKKSYYTQEQELFQ